MMRLDAHQHFWAFTERDYPWIPKNSPLHRDWLPADLQPLLEAHRVTSSVAVQARQTVEESHWLLTLADHFPFIQGVVGWVDLRSDRVEEQLDTLAAHPKFVGVRHVVQDEPDDSFMSGKEFRRGIGKLAAYRLTYDILIYPHQLKAAIELVHAFPTQPFVLDHLAKPFIKTGALSPWREQLAELGTAPNVFCKLSGLITEADHRIWKESDFHPYLNAAFETFGTERLMFGSDWPVCLLAGTYDQVFTLIDRYLHTQQPSAREAVLGRNAARFYLHRRQTQTGAREERS